MKKMSDFFLDNIPLVLDRICRELIWTYNTIEEAFVNRAWLDTVLRELRRYPFVEDDTRWVHPTLISRMINLQDLGCDWRLLPHLENKSRLRILRVYEKMSGYQLRVHPEFDYLRGEVSCCMPNLQLLEIRTKRHVLRDRDISPDLRCRYVVTNAEYFSDLYDLFSRPEDDDSIFVWLLRIDMYPIEDYSLLDSYIPTQVDPRDFGEIKMRENTIYPILWGPVEIEAWRFIGDPFYDRWHTFDFSRSRIVPLSASIWRWLSWTPVAVSVNWEPLPPTQNRSEYAVYESRFHAPHRKSLKPVKVRQNYTQPRERGNQYSKRHQLAQSTSRKKVIK